MVAEELKNMKKVHQESLKKPQSPIHTSFETKYNQLNIKYNDLLKLCEDADAEPEKVNNLINEFDKLAIYLDDKVSYGEKNFKSLILDPPESLDDALEEMEAQIDDVIGLKRTLDALESVVERFDELSPTSVIGVDRNVKEQYGK